VSVSLEVLLSRKVEIQWYEAVAIVLALCRAVQRADDPAHVPGLREIEIDEEGRVSMLPGGRSSEHVVTRLGRILYTILPERSVPPPLRIVVSHAASPAPLYQSVDEFSEALQYFERPGAVDLIRQVYVRWSTMPVEATEPLPDVPLWEPVPPAVAAAPHRRRRLVAAVVGLVVCAVAVGWLWREPRVKTFTAARGSEAARALSKAGAAAADTAKSALTALRARTGSQPREAAVTPGLDEHEVPASAAAAAVVSEQPKARSTPAPAPAVLKAAPLAVYDLEVFMRTAAAAESAPMTRPPLPPEEEMEAARLDATVYTSRDEEVTPPVPLSPVMPQVLPPGLGIEDLGVMSLVISETGEVESIRLHAPLKRMIDIMALSAAKAWRFQPAMKDGRPVKYRKLVWLSLP
jgi:hypothetical protein